MIGILEFILQDIDKKDLDRSQTMEYIDYLEELLSHQLPIYQQEKIQTMHDNLLRRLQHLNQK